MRASGTGRGSKRGLRLVGIFVVFVAFIASLSCSDEDRLPAPPSTPYSSVAFVHAFNVITQTTTISFADPKGVTPVKAVPPTFLVRVEASGADSAVVLVTQSARITDAEYQQPLGPGGVAFIQVTLPEMGVPYVLQGSVVDSTTGSTASLPPIRVIATDPANRTP